MNMNISPLKPLTVKNAGSAKSRGNIAPTVGPFFSETKMNIGYFKLERIKSGGKVLRHDLVCTKCGQLINVDDFVNEWGAEDKNALWDWIEAQGFHCEHYLKWAEEEEYWDDECRAQRRWERATFG
jgi:hypothetical protein